MVIAIGIGVPLTNYRDKTFVEDNFNRANSTSLGNAPTGQNWVGNNIGILSNEAYTPNLTADAISYVNAEIYDSMRVSIDVVNNTNNAGIIFRHKDAGNYFRFCYSGGTLLFQKKEGWALTTLASKAIAIGYPATFAVKVIGSDFVGYVDGSSELSANSTFQQTRKFHGVLIHNSTLTRLDNFLTEVL
jgi:hypothetical protein